MKIGKFLYTNRVYTPVPFFIAAVVLASPRSDLMIFGAILMIFGELIRIISIGYLGASSQGRNIVTDKFVTNGPYAYIRNPMYTGNIFIFMGASIFAGGWLPFMLYLVILYFSIEYSLNVKFEEWCLEDVYGAKYIDYKESVPRFYPRLSSFPQKGRNKPEFMTALRYEKSTFIAIIGFIILVQLVPYFKS